MSKPAKQAALKWISARHLRHFIAQAQAVGVNVDLLLEDAGVVRERLDDPDYPVPVSAIELMLSAIMREQAQPLIGLRLAYNIQPATFGPLGYLAQSCTTFSDVLQVITRYSGLLSNIGKTSVVPVPGGVEVHWECLAGGKLFRQQATEYVLGTFVVLARLLIPGRKDVPASVSFAHAKPELTAHARRYISFFRCPVYFDKPFSAVTLSTQALQTRLPHGDSFMKEMLERHAANVLKQRSVTSTLSDEVRHLIRALTIDGAPSKETVAAQLGMSARNLHRKLGEEGSSYRALLDEVRLEIAVEHLQGTTESSAEISERLGFSTRQAFLRWFKQSTGKTPTEYRDE